MKARDRHRHARQLHLEGRHAEALEEYRWFYESAIAEDPAVCGVRNSFALSNWAELAEVYGPARDAIRRALDERRQRLLDGEHDVELLHDVVALEQKVGDASRVVDLVATLRERDPEFARASRRWVLEPLVENGAYDLARGLFEPGDLERELERLARVLGYTTSSEQLQTRMDRVAMRRRTQVHIYAEETQLLIRMCAGAGETVEAQRLRKRALELAPLEFRGEVRRWLDRG